MKYNASISSYTVRYVYMYMWLSTRMSIYLQLMLQERIRHVYIYTVPEVLASMHVAIVNLES